MRPSRARTASCSAPIGANLIVARRRVGRMDARSVIAEMRRRADRSRRPGMGRVGLEGSNALGVSMPNVRGVAGTCGVEHALALELWETAIREARILAT